MSSDLQTVIEKALIDIRQIISESDRPNRYPFRNRYNHTLRVLNWAKRIQAVEGGDIQIITLAVLFHDTGWEEGAPHAEVGARVVEEYLMNQKVDQSVVERVVSVTLNHNLRYKSSDELGIEERVMMDADVLDELGVTTLVWDAMSTMLEDQPGYQKTLKRSQEYFQRISSKRDSLKTQTGIKLFDERITVYENCIKEFAFELGVG